MKELLNPFRKGNFVKYFGSLSHDFKTFGQLIEINHENEILKLKLSTMFHQQNDEIYASSNEIRSVYATPQMLQDLGFAFSETTKLFTKDNVNLAFVKYAKEGTNIYGQPDGLMLVDLGFRIIENQDIDFSIEEEIMQKTADAHALHMIQNYWNLVLGIELDTQNLKPLWQY